MPAAEMLVNHPLARALGWALVHSLWQCALVALLYAGASALLREATASARHAAACAALLLMLLLPAATFFAVNSSPHATPRAAETQAQGVAGAAQGDAGQSLAAVFKGSPATFEDGAEERRARSALKERAADAFYAALPWLALAWLACVAVLAARLAGGWAFAGRLARGRAVAPVGPEWELALARLARRMNVRRAVRLCRSALVEVPAVVGWLRPVILVPAGALAGMSGAQLEAVIAHELAHVRRHDYLVNLLQAVVETALFYHPAVRWVSRRARAEREHACDDLAVEATGDVLLYARALAALEELRRQRTQTSRLALAADGGSLMQRISRLVKPRPARARRARPSLVATFAACAALACAAALSHAALAGHGGAVKPASLDEPGAKPARARRRVAVTFVALPMIHTYYQPRREKDTRRLLDALAGRGIRAVGFVKGGQLYEDGQPSEEKIGLLRMWLDAGHELGSEGYAHQSLFETPLAKYRENVERGEELTGRLARERGAPLRYFSYPYLNVGPDRATKEAFEKYLAGRGMQIHKVTIDNFDWLYGKVYMDARRAEDEARMRRIGDEYVEYMERVFEFYETLSRDTLGYEPPQVLMLTANGLNCAKAEDLFLMLERRGYEFVTLEEALRDAAYRLPDTYTGPWGISWLQRWAMARGGEFRKEPYLSDWMAQFDTFTKKWPPVQPKHQR